MSGSVPLYPFVLEPLEREMIWGGHALATRYGKPGSPTAKLGESWECWDDNRVTNGEAAGTTLAQLRTQLGRALTGHADPNAPFPLLTKFIDARHALSVQVHPTDEYARRVERQPAGKSECWYVLEADPGATIVLGWNRATSRGEFQERVRDGSLGELLRHVPARPGDVFYLPAGTLHAIGKGIVLFEVQQSSDLTYRIFDYDRRDPDGNPRALHVEKAGDVLDYGAGTTGAISSLEYPLHGLRRRTLVAARYFIVEHITLDSELRGLDLDGSPLAITALATPIELEARGSVVRLEAYQSAVVPAGLETVMLRGLGENAALLAAAPPADPEVIERRFSRAGVPVGDSTSFLAQF